MGTSILVLVTLLGLPAPPQDFIGKIPSSPLPQSGPFRIAVDRPTQLDADRARALANRDTCYTMRTYVFRRQDGNAPVLAGTTTCTPANAARPRKVGRPHEAGLVPAY